MLFISIILVAWAVYAFTLLKRNHSSMTVAVALMPLVVFSVILTVDLALNYAASLNTVLFDGMTLHGVFSHLIFPDTNWSNAIFYDAYQTSASVSFLLLIVMVFSAMASKNSFTTKKA